MPHSLPPVDSKGHQLFVVFAWVIFLLVPIGFPVGLGLYFSWRHRQRRLWIMVPHGTEGALYCEATGAWWVADGEAKKDFGFLFLTYQPSYWWWEVRRPENQRVGPRPVQNGGTSAARIGK